ncbi:carbohydrate ABC transporter permease [Jiangella aurantiaca]|uniref:Carbohydrate ABC transporter permease n=1 Tax=Jiangella aurantiaca TaxID=2530373 RepID=A0A4R5A7K8_9ACTN|nr:carbohydrate ABC transporter permease [Jiangella aurantiaca]TDD67090.1 carbohydrate ABC transporter permease [Jiangella aurantiaca]
MTRRRDAVVSHALLVLASLVALYPFLSILMLALNEPGRRLSGFALPENPSFGNFTNAWERGGFSDALVSSLIITGTVVVVAVLLSVLAGYALGVLDLPLAKVVVGVFLLGLVMPYEATVIPIYHQMKEWGLLGTYPAVILPQIAFSVALGTVWMRGYFGSIPATLREAGMIDGAGKLQVLRHILLPVAAPAVGVLATLLFLYTWNEFLLGLVLLSDNPDARTTPVALSFFAGNRRESDPGTTAAAAVLVALPVLIAYVAAQRKFVQGLLAGAVKE